jgi:predicted neutral ceramidase superfamily lipid hydrolase
MAFIRSPRRITRIRAGFRALQIQANIEHHNTMFGMARLDHEYRACTGIVGCCARAASGQAAPPPRMVMN